MKVIYLFLYLFMIFEDFNQFLIFLFHKLHNLMLFFIKK